jgi:hypothetical protein
MVETPKPKTPEPIATKPAVPAPVAPRVAASLPVVLPEPVAAPELGTPVPVVLVEPAGKTKCGNCGGFSTGSAISSLHPCSRCDWPNAKYGTTEHFSPR